MVQIFTNGTIGNTVCTNGNASGTIGSPNGKIGTIGKSMVPLATNGENPQQSQCLSEESLHTDFFFSAAPVVVPVPEHYGYEQPNIQPSGFGNFVARFDFFAE